MANGISRRSVHEALQQATDRDGNLDLWEFARVLADDVESWGESDFFAGSEDGETSVHRYFHILPRDKPQ